MGKMTMLSVVLMLAIWSLASSSLCNAATADSKPTCTEYGQPCKNKGECCGGCCQEGQCTPHTEACNSPVDPCRVHQCTPPKTCYLQKVQCLQSPCDPIPACRDPDYDYN